MSTSRLDAIVKLSKFSEDKRREWIELFNAYWGNYIGAGDDGEIFINDNFLDEMVRFFESFELNSAQERDIHVRFTNRMFEAGIEIKEDGTLYFEDDKDDSDDNGGDQAAVDDSDDNDGDQAVVDDSDKNEGDQAAVCDDNAGNQAASTGVMVAGPVSHLAAQKLGNQEAGSNVKEAGPASHITVQKQAATRRPTISRKVKDAAVSLKSTTYTQNRGILSQPQNVPQVQDADVIEKQAVDPPSKDADNIVMESQTVGPPSDSVQVATVDPTPQISVRADTRNAETCRSIDVTENQAVGPPSQDADKIDVTENQPVDPPSDVVSLIEVRNQDSATVDSNPERSVRADTKNAETDTTSHISEKRAPVSLQNQKSVDNPTPELQNRNKDSVQNSLDPDVTVAENQDVDTLQALPRQDSVENPTPELENRNDDSVQNLADPDVIIEENQDVDAVQVAALDPTYRVLRPRVHYEHHPLPITNR